MTTNVPVPPSGDGGLPLSLSGNRVSRGIRAGWTDTTGWRDRDGLPIPDLLMVIAYLIVLRRWLNKKPFYITGQVGGQNAIGMRQRMRGRDGYTNSITRHGLGLNSVAIVPVKRDGGINETVAYIDDLPM